MCRRSGTTRSSAGCSTCSRLPASSASWSSPEGWWWTRHEALTKCMFVRVDKLSGVHLLRHAVAECVACQLSPPACPCRGSAAQGLYAIPQKAGGGPDCCLMLLVETSCDRLEEFRTWSESTHVSLPACQSGAASWAFQIFPQTGSSLWQQLVLANGVSTRSGPSLMMCYHTTSMHDHQYILCVPGACLQKLLSQCNSIGSCSAKGFERQRL